jgi:hypothetical protein
MPKSPSDLLYDSETTLRLVDSALSDLDVRPIEGLALALEAAREDDQLGLLGLSRVFSVAHSELTRILQGLRQSRETLEQGTVERLQHTHDKLREIAGATESAATDILNGLERSMVLVDTLEDPAADHAASRAELREVLFALMGCMQFQDITSQQLNYASSVLVELEERLADIARVFDPAAFGVATIPAAPPNAAFDPAATTQDAGKRQALVDSILGASAA